MPGEPTGIAPSLLSKQDPSTSSRRFRIERYRDPLSDSSALVYAGGEFFAWDGVAYRPKEVAALKAELRPWLERFERELVRLDGSTRVVPFQPMKRDLAEVLDALADQTYCGQRPPVWLTNVGDLPDPLPDPERLIVATNGVFDLFDVSAPISRPSPILFTVNALDYPLDVDAPRPARFLALLNQMFGGDAEAVALLQEWFGYCLTADTRQQKILMVVGPRRSGKGTVARVLGSLIGIANVCAPTLAGLTTNFGLWPLVNKRLAIISDARLGGRTDQTIVTERLLSISGEDAITLDRKNLPSITLKLTTRFMICTNELPRLSDASGALAGRLLVLRLTESFYGREELDLTERLLTERSGILKWSIAGWHRLQQRGRFLQPTTGKAMIDEMHDLASPVGAFVRDWCDVRPGLCVPIDDLYSAWSLWCREQGRDQRGTKQVFGRDLRSALPAIGSTQTRDGRERVRQYQGIALTPAASATLAHFSVGRGISE